MDKVEVYRDGASEWRWRYKASNGRIMADSGEGYAARHGAVNAALRLFGLRIEDAWTGTARNGDRTATWRKGEGYHRSLRLEILHG